MSDLPTASVAPKTDEKLLSETNVLLDGGAADVVVPLKPVKKIEIQFEEINMLFEDSKVCGVSLSCDDIRKYIHT